MNARLHSLVADAESRLAPDEQDALADLLDRYIANHNSDRVLTGEERAHLKRIAAEPFVAASAEEVAAYFNRSA